MGAASALQANGNVSLNSILENYKSTGEVVNVCFSCNRNSSLTSGIITNINIKEGWFELEDSNYKQIIFTSWIDHITARK